MSVQTVLVEAIMNGKFDNQLEQLAVLIKSRREMVGQQLLATLKSGDKVRFNDNVRPRYLRGKTATIERVTGNKAYVRMDYPAGRYRPENLVGVPSTLLERN